jgi:hypothetical protein
MVGSNKRKYFRIAAFMVLLTTFLPVVTNNLPRFIGSPHFFAAIWLGSVLLFYSRLLFQRSLLYILTYGLVFIVLLLNTLWSEITDWNKGGIQIEYYFYLLSISVILYFKVEKDYKSLAWLVKWSLIFIGITAIMSIYSASVDPMYARNMIGSTWNSMEDMQYFKQLGGGTHGFATSLGALFPMMIYYYRNNTNSIFSKKIIIIFGVLCFIALLRIQVFANILLSSVIIVVAMLGRKRIKQSLLVLAVFFIVFFIIPGYIYADLMVSLSSYFDPDSEVYYKLNDLAKFINLGDNYGTATGGRVSRYTLLLDAFIKNPLLGYFVTDHNKDISAGGHLYWMNKLAILGLAGFIPFIIVHISYIKTAIKYFSEEFTFYFLVSVFSVLGLGFMKNLAGREMWFTYFILLPGLYFLPLLKKKKLKAPISNAVKMDDQLIQK